MTSKLFEIRDRATFIPVLAVKLDYHWDCERYLLRRAGYNLNDCNVILFGIVGGLDKATCDPYDWGDRTRTTAHEYIIKNFDALESGQVIDVEFILGETTEPKQSERITNKI